MNIPKEAVEAAARELNIYVTPWEDLKEEQRNGWRSQAHAALRAAAPMLMAQAWDEGAKAMMRAVSEEQSVSFIAPNNPYRP